MHRYLARPTHLSRGYGTKNSQAVDLPTHTPLRPSSAHVRPHHSTQAHVDACLLNGELEEARALRLPARPCGGDTSVPPLASAKEEEEQGQQQGQQQTSQPRIKTRQRASAEASVLCGDRRCCAQLAPRLPFQATTVPVSESALRELTTAIL